MQTSDKEKAELMNFIENVAKDVQKQCKWQGFPKVFVFAANDGQFVMNGNMSADALCECFMSCVMENPIMSDAFVRRLAMIGNYAEHVKKMQTPQTGETQ